MIIKEKKFMLMTMACAMFFGVATFVPAQQVNAKEARWDMYKQR